MMVRAMRGRVKGNDGQCPGPFTFRARPLPGRLAGVGLHRRPRWVKRQREMGAIRMAAMIRNRSLPVDTVLPHVMFRDLPAAIAWLSRVFGFIEHYHYGEPMSGAQMYLGPVFLMVKQVAHATPKQLGFGTQSLTIFVEDVEGHYAHAKAAGATILEEPHETVYGEFQYAAADLDGHHWLFSRHARDLSPAEWGATMVHDPQQKQ